MKEYEIKESQFQYICRFIEKELKKNVALKRVKFTIDLDYLYSFVTAEAVKLPMDFVHAACRIYMQYNMFEMKLIENKIHCDASSLIRVA